MRKKAILLLLAALFLPRLYCPAQEHLSERVYLSLDRDVYVSGDELFLSAFCLDMATGRFSAVSKTAYVEIYSQDGPVQTAKLALEGGRGGGVLRLKNTIPTGNYRIVAYTAQCFNEQGYDFREGSRNLSIINPFTTERSKSGVELLTDEAYAELVSPARSASGPLNVRAAAGVLTVSNPSGSPVSVSLSLHHDDGIVSPSAATPSTFLSGASRGKFFTQERLVDYEGEVIRARVRATQDGVDLNGATLSLSVPGRSSDFYQARVMEDGTATFITRNIPGNTEALLETDELYGPVNMEIIQPFAQVSDSGLPALPLCRGLEDKIRLRSVSMQVRKAIRSDSLYLKLEVPHSDIFAADSVEYILDDYTRFPLMEELFVEYILELRTRRSGGRRSIVSTVYDTYKPVYENPMPVLLLLDGVIVADHELIYAYDPLLVERIVIYPHTFNLGARFYSGIVNFVTYKHDMPSFQPGENVRVFEFTGTCEPVASYLPDTLLGVEDLRQTILWHPLVELAPGETRIFEYCLPSYEGDFEAVVEGFSADGVPVYSSVRVAK